MAVDRRMYLLASLDAAAWRIVRGAGLWGDVQSRLERRSVHQVDRVSGVLDTIQERIEPLREPVLRELPRRVPRRWIRPSESEDFVIVVEPHHLFIDEVDVGR